MRTVRVVHKETNTLIAEGIMGKGITVLEENVYIRKKLIKSGVFKPTYKPGLCSYKGVYVWMDFVFDSGEKAKKMGWMYWLPNPLFPFIWYTIAIRLNHPELKITANEEVATS
jgi:uncharacterized protein (DUF427 family)